MSKKKNREGKETQSNLNLNSSEISLVVKSKKSKNIEKSSKNKRGGKAKKIDPPNNEIHLITSTQFNSIILAIIIVLVIYPYLPYFATYVPFLPLAIQIAEFILGRLNK